MRSALLWLAALGLVTNACASKPTPWDQGIATVSAVQIDTTEPQLKLDEPVGPRLQADGTFCISNPADLAVFNTAFGDETIAVVAAPDGTWRLSLAPPLDVEPSGAWGQHLEMSCTID